MGDSRETRHLVDAGMGSISAVVATLPAGYTLGEARVVSGVKYKLIYNACNSVIPPGTVVTPLTRVSANAGAYSMTLTTAVEVNHHIGAAVVVHQTMATGTYGWAAVRGVVGGLIGDTASLPTGSAFYVGALGAVKLMPASVITGVVPIGAVITTVSNGGAKNGNAWVSFPEL